MYKICKQSVYVLQIFLLQIFFYFVGIKSSSPASTCVNPPSPPTAPPPPPLTAAVTSTTGERRLSVPGSPKPMLPARSTKPSSNHRQRMITVYRVDALLYELALLSSKLMVILIFNISFFLMHVKFIKYQKLYVLLYHRLSIFDTFYEYINYFILYLFINSMIIILCNSGLHLAALYL